MTTSTRRTRRRRRLAIPLLVLTLAGAGTVATAGTASAASTGAGRVADSGLDFGPARNRDRLDLTGGGGRTGKSDPQRKAPSGPARYVVELADEPVAAYTGEIPGLARTRPADGGRLAPHSAAAKAYREHLGARRSAVTEAAHVKVDQVYTTAFDGFSATLTPAQVDALKREKRVRSVVESRAYSINQAAPGTADPTPTAPTTTAPTTGAPTAEATTGAPVTGAATGAGTAPAQQPAGAKPGKDTGAGIVIGVLDSGIWPDSPSFARTMPAPPGWHGTCQTGVMFVAEHCNGKIVGARYFADTYLAATGGLPDGEVLSARDMVGHGTHTASTAAGLPVEHVTISGRDFDSVSGVAPDAQIAVYKVLWGGAGYDADIIAGIDAAVADGVQVLNYSIGKQLGDWDPNTPIGTAFLNATLAGVFVSAAAGNDGFSGAISNAQPWVTTVGAAVTNVNEGTLQLGNGTRIAGASLDVLPGGRPRPLVFGEQAGNLDDGSAYCYGLDPAKVKDKVVACALDDPYAAVAEARGKGATALVLFDPVGNFRVNSIFDFPVLYLNSKEQAGKIFNYLMRHPTDGTAVVTSGGDGSSVPAGVPSVADYSSTGPDKTHNGLMKPDLVAPGSDIIAAVSPPGNFGRYYDAYSGTSMATPHVAGAAAILRAKHPDWSPGAIASALRTTAVDTVGTDNPLTQGSGLLALDRADDPGLVLEPAAADLVAFASAAQPDGRELNLPSISLREYDGTRSVTLTRKLTNVGGKKETYQASVTGLPGMEINVTPKVVTVPPGTTATVTITLRRGSAPWDRYVTGAITWRSAAHQVKVPVAARPWGISPRLYDDNLEDFNRLTTGAFGSMQPGFTGKVSGRSTGYAPIRWDSYSMPAGVNGGVFDPEALGVRTHTFTVPAGSAGIVVETATDDPNTNLDLWLYKGDKLVYRSAASWHSSERAWVFMPEAGTYTAYVFAQASGGPVVDYRLGHVVLGRDGRYAPATLELPARVERGTTASYKLRPNAALAENLEYWAYTELSADGQVIPGQLVSTEQFWWE
ncbi:S8 family serine peptidase [Micromonospora sp. NPDC050495]|uniref:S8 family serine peptidase n=1 Tax=Micromonospora sp. NPDC050495 TaxID=3154936 RepID=UPI0033CD0C8E